MIKTRNLSFSFDTEDTKLFSDINVTVEAGETLAVPGRNGVGKTTPLKCILGLVKVQTGTVERAEYIGYVPQKIFRFLICLLLKWL